jgi:hypothetical protein
MIANSTKTVQVCFSIHVVYPGVAGNVEESAHKAREIREADVDVVVIYHATYVDDAMSLAVFDELGPKIMTTIAYMRVSTGGQEVDPQRLAILDYAHRQGLKVDAQKGGYPKKLWSGHAPELLAFPLPVGE